MTDDLRQALRDLPDTSRNVAPDFAERVITSARRRRRALRAGSAGLAAAAVAAIVAAGVTLTGTSSAARIMPVTPPATSPPATPPVAQSSASVTALVPKGPQATLAPTTPSAPVTAPPSTFSGTAASPTSTATFVPPPSVAPSTPPPVVATSTPATPTCLTAQLVFSLQYLQGAGGTEYNVLSMGNVSNIACTLTGYPVVVLTDPQGKSVTAADAPRGKPVATITLASGGFASTFVLALDNACTTAQGPQYTYAKTVTVTPPGNAAGQVVAASGIPLCENAVEPMQSGAQPSPG
jgi:hypothetical protein